MRWGRLVFVALAMPASAAAANCKAELDMVVAKHLLAGPFRVESVFTLNGKLVTDVTEVVLPDRVHKRPATGELIMVGDILWMKQGGAWVRTARAVLPEERPAVYFDLADQVASADDTACRDAVTREGSTYRVFAFTSHHKVGSWGADWPTILYVNPASGLPAFAEVGLAKPEFTDTYVYDRAITIVAPE
jgi:hypothetical protein